MTEKRLGLHITAIDPEDITKEGRTRLGLLFEIYDTCECGATVIQKEYQRAIFPKATTDIREVADTLQRLVDAMRGESAV